MNLRGLENVPIPITVPLVQVDAAGNETSRTDLVVPLGYRMKSPSLRGDGISTSHTYTHCSIVCKQYNRIVTLPNGSSITNPNPSTPPPSAFGLSGTLSSLFINKTLFSPEDLANKAYSKARRNGIELGETLGEGRESVTWIAQKARQVARMYSAIKRGKPSELKRVFKGHVKKPGSSYKRSAASRWLEYNYAVMPLVNDVTDAVNLLSAGLEEDPEFQVVVTKTINESGVSESSDPDNIYSTPRYRYRWEAKVKMKMTLRMDASRVRDIRNQLGLDSPVLVGWNLLPLSFVADWGWKIGEFLAALSGKESTHFVRGFTSIKIKSTASALPQYVDGYSDEISAHWLGEGYRIDPLIGSPVLTAPRIVNPLSSSHVASAAALLTTIFGGRRR
jgi:hypothetical protein